MFTGITLGTDHDFKISLVIYKTFPCGILFNACEHSTQHEVVRMPQWLVRFITKPITSLHNNLSINLTSMTF